MNAKELLEYFDLHARREWSAASHETILRALRLLAAAEANDGERSQLIEELRTEADLCRNETAEDVAELLEDAASSIVAISALANALKDECNGLAARVRELEGRLSDITAAHHAFLAGNRPDAIDEAIDALVEQMNDEIVDDAERSKP